MAGVVNLATGNVRRMFLSSYFARYICRLYLVHYRLEANTRNGRKDLGPSERKPVRTKSRQNEIPTKRKPIRTHSQQNE